MKYLILLLGLLLIGCHQYKSINEKDNLFFSEDNSPNPVTLFKQTYPKHVRNPYFLDLVPKQVLESLPLQLKNEFGFDLINAKSEKIKIFTATASYLGDTSVCRVEFDKVGNILYKKSFAWSEGYYYRYGFDKEGKVSKIFKFFDNKELYLQIHFHYNKNKQINYVKVIDSDNENNITNFDYDIDGNVTKISNKTSIKTLKYDNQGSCIEWVLDIKDNQPHCGNVITHWKGKYDINGNLVRSWNDVDLFLYNDYDRIPEFKTDTLFSESGQVLSLKTYKKNDEFFNQKAFEYKDDDKRPKVVKTYDENKELILEEKYEYF